MTQPLTLSSIFEKTKGELESSLSGLTLPKDSAQVQGIIADYLNNVCDENSEYRQNLTQSEDYILQAALSMLNAQRDLVSALNCTPKIEIQHVDIEPINEATAVLHGPVGIGVSALRSTSGYTMIGAGGGALVGKLIFGGWGAVFGAIAGTAVALYLSQQSQSTTPERKRIPSKNTTATAKVCDSPVNTDLLLKVISQICESLDNLISTFRAQIQRVVNKYESQPTPTLENNYHELLESLQSILGALEVEKANLNIPKGIRNKKEDILATLESYDISVIYFDGTDTKPFSIMSSPNVTQNTLVFPALAKNGKVILKGRILSPQK